jgi:hypothetical protein
VFFIYADKTGILLLAKADVSMFNEVLISYAFWVGGAAVVLSAIVLMLKRKLRRDFPLFFSYLLLQICQSVVLVVARSHYQQYFYTYWTFATLNVFVEFAVVYEIFAHVFRPYDALRKIAMVLFRWSALVLVMVAVVAATSNGQGGWSRAMATILALERSIRVMQVGLVLFLFLFSQQVGLTHKHRIFGISLGFGVIAGVDLAIVTLLTSMGETATVPLSLLSSGTFFCASGVWLYYMIIQEPARIKVEQVIEAGHFNMALSGAMHPQQQDSFLPFIEGAVERILQERASKA